VDKPQEEAVTIHDITKSKEEHLDKFLIYDRYEKVGLIDHVVEKDITKEDFYNGNKITTLAGQTYSYSLANNGKAAQFQYRGGDFVFSKKINLPAKNSFDIEYNLSNAAILNSRDFAIEFNLFVLSSQDSHIVVRDEEYFLFDQFSFDEVDELSIEDKYRKIAVDFKLGGMTVFCVPIYSVSSSESGFEKVFQQASLLFIPRGKKKFTVSMEIK